MKRLPYLLISLALFSSVAHATVAGSIAAEGGQVERIGADGQHRSAGLHDKVDVGDVFVTGRDGWVVLSMVDSASLTLKANTRMRLGDYTDGAGTGKPNIFLDLLAGSLRSITGLIGRHTPQAYALHTPTATMGIRGTDHEVAVVAPGGADEAGTYDHVYDGRTVMRAGGGETELAAGETGHAPHGGNKPHKLDKQPALYDKLQQFSSEHGIDKVLDGLHGRSGKGYTLPANAAASDKAGAGDKDANADKGKDKDAGSDKGGAGDKDANADKGKDKDAGSDKTGSGDKDAGADKDAGSDKGKGDKDDGKGQKEPPKHPPKHK